MPVVAVYDIELAEKLLHRAKTMVKSISHPVHLIQDIAGAI
jgi:hypothetical protein